MNKQNIKQNNPSVSVETAFCPFHVKIESFLCCKDKLPKSVKFSVVYQFTYTGCNTRYISEAKRQVKTWIEEHFSKDNRSHVYQITYRKISNSQEKLILAVLILLIELFPILDDKSITNKHFMKKNCFK